MKNNFSKLTKSIKSRGIKSTLREIYNQVIFSRYKSVILKNNFDKNNIEYGLNQVKRDEEIIISFTTIPSRIEKSIYVIDVLLSQTVKPDNVILYLGRDEFRNFILPPEIENLIKRGLKIEYVEDLGPHTKYFYAIQNNPNSIVITVDDDRIYNKNLVELFMKTHVLFPNCVCANWVKEMVINNEHISPHESWPRVKVEGKPSNMFFALGVDGVLYPPNILPKQTFDKKNIKELCLFADDIWLKSMELINNIPVVKVIGSGDSINMNIEGTQKQSLNHENEGRDRNSVYLDQVFNHFELFKYLVYGGNESE